MDRWIADDTARDQLAAAQQQRTLENYSHEALARTWAEFFLRQLANRQQALSPKVKS
jgi:hypothetical protein